MAKKINTPTPEQQQAADIKARLSDARYYKNRRDRAVNEFVDDMNCADLDDFIKRYPNEARALAYGTSVIRIGNKFAQSRITSDDEGKKISLEVVEGRAKRRTLEETLEKGIYINGSRIPMDNSSNIGKDNIMAVNRLYEKTNFFNKDGERKTGDEYKSVILKTYRQEVVRDEDGNPVRETVTREDGSSYETVKRQNVKDANGRSIVDEYITSWGPHNDLVFVRTDIFKAQFFEVKRDENGAAIKNTKGHLTFVYPYVLKEKTAAGKDNPALNYFGKKLTLNQAIALCNTSIVPLTGCTRKDGTTFNCILQATANGQDAAIPAQPTSTEHLDTIRQILNGLDGVDYLRKDKDRGNELEQEQEQENSKENALDLD